MEQTILPPEVVACIEQSLKKYPSDRRQSAVMDALTAAQEHNGGHLTRPLMDAVAVYLGIPKIAVYEVATFYSMYELKPVGRHKLCVCTNISCALRGSDEIVAHLQQRLGIGLGETTDDGRVTLKEVECLGACVGAPVLQLGDQYHEHLTKERVDLLLEELS